MANINEFITVSYTHLAAEDTLHRGKQQKVF